MRPNNGAVQNFCLLEIILVFQFLENSKIKKNSAIIKPLLTIRKFKE